MLRQRLIHQPRMLMLGQFHKQVRDPPVRILHRVLFGRVMELFLRFFVFLAVCSPLQLVGLARVLHVGVIILIRAAESPHDPIVDLYVGVDGRLITLTLSNGGGEGRLDVHVIHDVRIGAGRARHLLLDACSYARAWILNIRLHLLLLFDFLAATSTLVAISHLRLTRLHLFISVSSGPPHLVLAHVLVQGLLLLLPVTLGRLDFVHVHCRTYLRAPDQIHHAVVGLVALRFDLGVDYLLLLLLLYQSIPLVLFLLLLQL